MIPVAAPTSLDDASTSAPARPLATAGAGWERETSADDVAVPIAGVPGPPPAGKPTTIAGGFGSGDGTAGSNGIGNSRGGAPGPVGGG